jgi:hypothetical protein
MKLVTEGEAQVVDGAGVRKCRRVLDTALWMIGTTLALTAVTSGVTLLTRQFCVDMRKK